MKIFDNNKALSRNCSQAPHLNNHFSSCTGSSFQWLLISFLCWLLFFCGSPSRGCIYFCTPKQYCWLSGLGEDSIRFRPSRHYFVGTHSIYSSIFFLRSSCLFLCREGCAVLGGLHRLSGLWFSSFPKIKEKLHSSLDGRWSWRSFRICWKSQSWIGQGRLP